ncbi:tetratricopeptide repeat protein [Trinickia sp. NRRL B-1857]|uniref:tetratricopeptide repeat protein n=1 Tax=Trinickia sp. NRRL B-1857 TaxID=3162879 RepID=UPI003D290624
MAIDRPRIATPLMLAGAACAIVGALAASYVAGGLRGKIVDNAAPSELTVAYLEAWLRSAPNDPVYLSALANQYLALGRCNEAHASAARLSALGVQRSRREAIQIELRCDEQRAFAAPADSPRRAALLVRIAGELDVAAREDWSAAELDALASQALSVGAPAIAARYQARLSQVDPRRRTYWQKQSARQWLAAGEYGRAAAAYFAAQAGASNLDEARAAFIAGVRALQAGNLLNEALAQAQAHLSGLENDRQSLEVLLQLARAAHRPDLVDRYARALMQFVDAGHAPAASNGTAPRAIWIRLASARVGGRMASAAATARIIPAVLTGALRGNVRRIGEKAAAAAPAVSDLASTLYQAFLESNDLEYAAKIASDQVARHPDAPEWRKRLAQVDEWRNKPAAALQAWLAYAHQTGDAAGWSNVQRIAPMLDDDASYVQALIHASDAAPEDLKLVDGVVAADERLGRPDDALAFLKARMTGARQAQIGSRYALLSERAGYVDQALKTWQALHESNRGNVEYALHSANLLYRMSDLPRALRALEAVQPYATDRDVLYWRTYGQLARLLQNDADSTRAYRHLLAGGEETSEDLAAMTFFYERQPLDAARLAQRQYERDHTARALRDAIASYLSAHAPARAGALLSSLTPAERAAAERDPGFLAARAEYERQSGQFAAALADLRLAVALPGVGDDTRAAYLWMLVDSASAADVRAALRQWRGRALEDESLWGPFAAAELRLNRPVAALRYLRLQAASMQRDPLWLLTYADAQEMAGHPGIAAAVRRHVWLDLLSGERNRNRASSGGGEPLRLPDRSDWEAVAQLAGRRATLAQTLADGDAARHLLDALTAPAATAPSPLDESEHSLLGETPGLSPLPSATAGSAEHARLLEAVARDVAVAWAISGERYGVAKRWLARRYARRLLGAQDERLAIALADDDVQTIEQLLDQRTAPLPRYSRIDASMRVDRQGAAQALAFDALDGAPDDTELHTRLVDATMFWSQSIDASIDDYVEHPLDYVQQTLAASLKLSDHYMIGLHAQQRMQRSTDTSQLVNLPSVDRSVDLNVRRLTHDALFSLDLGRRDAVSAFYTAKAAATLGRNAPLSLTATIERSAEATEQQTLTVGGVKDSIGAGMTWQRGPRWSCTASVEADRFYSQARSFVGSGVLEQAEIDYKIRTEYPDYTIRIAGAHGAYHASGQADALLQRLAPAALGPVSAATFMPNSYTQFGAFVGFGNDLLDRYTHAWRPYLDVGMVHDTNQGWGLQTDIGFAGSVLGGDHAALYFQHERVAAQGSSVTVIGARYRWFY